MMALPIEICLYQLINSPCLKLLPDQGLCQPAVTAVSWDHFRLSQQVEDKVHFKGGAVGLCFLSKVGSYYDWSAPLLAKLSDQPLGNNMTAQGSFLVPCPSYVTCYRDLSVGTI